ncbi:MAG: Gfo/Idh/MocA family oxidoreductase [Saprospiraceae bacterium]|nr:Gfo/Idh/MocA family oxidoreductase [Saprospiraceae bacterium]
MARGKNKIGFGIIGAGAIAQLHAKCIQELDQAQLIGVASASSKRAVENQPFFTVPVTSSYTELIANDKVEIICICTPSGMHLEPGEEAARYGKHVLCEKPLEITTRRSDRLITACRKAGVKLGCVFQNRLNPHFIRLKEGCSKGIFGRLVLANAYVPWYREPSYYRTSVWKGTLKGDGGAALINQGIHTLDLMLNIMGMPVSVYAQTSTLVHQIEGEDLAQALLEFESGAKGAVLASTCLKPGYPERLEVYGEKGSAILEGGRLKSWNVNGSIGAEGGESGAGSGASDPMAIGHMWHKAQIQDMIEAVLHDRSPLVDGGEGRKSVAVIESIYRSAESGAKVLLREA